MSIRRLPCCKSQFTGFPKPTGTRSASARLVACPGCYPTSILVPLLPVIRAKMIRLSSIVVNSLSGVSGAGRKADTDLLFVECNESARPYGLPSHRHLSEIEQELSIAAGEPVIIQFAPHLIPLSRGILTTIHVDPVTKRDRRLSRRSVRDCLRLRMVHSIAGTESIPGHQKRRWYKLVGNCLAG